MSRGLILLFVAAVSYADYPVYTEITGGLIQTPGISTINLPSIVKAANGDIVAQFNKFSDQYPGSQSFTARSTNGGFTWDLPLAQFSTVNSSEPLESVHTNVGLTTLSNGVIVAPMAIGSLYSSPTGGSVFSGIKYTRTHVSRSLDNGVTWSTPSVVNAGPTHSSPFGRIIEKSDGSLMLPIISNDAWGNQGALDYWRSGYLTSYDQGITWTVYTEIGNYGETAVMQFSNGAYLAVAKKHGSNPPSKLLTSYDGITWMQGTGTTGGGKNATLHTSPNGFTLVLHSVSGGKGQGVYTIDQGHRFYPAFEIEPGAYALSAVNNGQELIVLYSLNNTLRYKVFREDIRFGQPEGYAIGEEPVQIKPVVSTEEKPFAYPCPWRSDQHSGKPITFARLNVGDEIRLFTVTGQLVRKLYSSGDKTEWDLTNDRGERVASGVYLFAVGKNVGKLVIIK